MSTVGRKRGVMPVSMASELALFAFVVDQPALFDEATLAEFISMSRQHGLDLKSRSPQSVQSSGESAKESPQKSQNNAPVADTRVSPASESPTSSTSKLKLASAFAPEFVPPGNAAHSAAGLNVSANTGSPEAKYSPSQDPSKMLEVNSRVTAAQAQWVGAPPTPLALPTSPYHHILQQQQLAREQSLLQQQQQHQQRWHAPLPPPVVPHPMAHGMGGPGVHFSTAPLASHHRNPLPPQAPPHSGAHGVVTALGSHHPPYAPPLLPPASGTAYYQQPVVFGEEEVREDEEYYDGGGDDEFYDPVNHDHDDGETLEHATATQTSATTTSKPFVFNPSTPTFTPPQPAAAAAAAAKPSSFVLNPATPTFTPPQPAAAAAAAAAKPPPFVFNLSTPTFTPSSSGRSEAVATALRKSGVASSTVMQCIANGVDDAALQAIAKACTDFGLGANGGDDEAQAEAVIDHAGLYFLDPPPSLKEILQIASAAAQL